MSISNVRVGFDINKRGYKNHSRMFFIYSNTLLTCVTAASLPETTVNWRVVQYFKKCTFKKPKQQEQCSKKHEVRRQ